MVQYENEICQYLGIPSIPKRKWDGKQSFLRGCATIVHDDGSKSYAVATFDNEQHNEPRILKVFSLERYVDVHEIFVVPPYMDTNVDDMDLDEESKEKAKILVDEAKELEVNGSEQDFDEPKNEYFFDNKKPKGGVPRTHEGLIVRLSVIYNELNKK